MHGKSIVIRGRGIVIDAALDDIQIMPPGTHVITPIGPDGKPITLTVTVTEHTARALEAARNKYQAEADAQVGDAPYIDFNHDDGPAAGWIKSIYWGGDDPHTGGVRAKVEWSDAGREAIEGRLFRRFSPAFFIDPATSQITGAPVNMGGLVNRAAFRNIAAFFAQSTSQNTMTEEQIAALLEENTTLKRRIAELEAQLAAAAKEKAEAVVADAAKDGRIPPAPEVKSKWVAAILADPSARELLASLPPNPALQTIIRSSQPPADTSSAREALLEQFAKLPRSERPAFFAAHRDILTSKS